MKIAVTSNGPNLDGFVEARFGRCPYFLIIDPDTQEVESIPNPNVSLGGGAGPQSAQLMATKGVSVVLTGNCGPNAFRTFGAAGIQVITGVSGPIREAVDQFKSGSLSQSSAPNVQSHFGMGSGTGMGGGGMGGGRGGGMGRGMGGGMGGGRGGGMGRGMGGGMSPTGVNTGTAVPPDPSRDSGGQDVDALKEMASSLRGQLEALENQIHRLDKNPAGTKKEPS